MQKANLATRLVQDRATVARQDSSPQLRSRYYALSAQLVVIKVLLDNRFALNVKKVHIE